MAVRTQSSTKRVFRMLKLPSIFVLFAIASSLIFTGCTKDDLYAQCNLANRAEIKQRRCAADDKNSCAFTNFLQCDTRVCAKYLSSEPFCSKRCEEDKECGDGQCVAFFVGFEQKYCVPKSALSSK